MSKKRKENIKRIGIDARFYGPMGKGLGRYTQEIVDNIVKIDKDNEYVIFLSKCNFNEFETDNPKVKKVLADICCYTWKEQIIFPMIIYKEKVDLMHFLHFNVPVFLRTKFIATVHDLILTKFPTVRASTLSPMMYRIKNLGYKVAIHLVIKRAKKIITVSEFTKQDIVKKFKVKPNKIIVTYEGVANLAKGRDSLFVSKIDKKKTLEEYNIGDNFLLYIGNAYPHKNLEGLLEVFERLYKYNKDLRLVLVGKEDYFYTQIKKLAKEKGMWNENENKSPVIFTGYVSDTDLEVLFRKALVYVFPSFYEGFGLPPLEAMAKECAVVSSNKASLPEVLGEAAIYFDPYNKEDMYQKIKSTMFNSELKKDLIEKGLKQIKKYSWWECTWETLSVYNNVLKRKIND